MRIAFYVDTFYPEISGISDSILTLGEQLQKDGHGVLCVAPYHPKKNYKNSENAHPALKKLQIIRIPSLPVPGSPTGQWRFALPVLASWRAMRKFKPDVIHVQTPFGTGIEAVLISRLLGIPLVGTNHTPIQEFVRYSPINGAFAEKIARKYDAWFYNRCSFVTAPYQGLIDAMRAQGFKRAGKGQPNPVLIDKFSIPSSEEKAALKKKFNVAGPLIFYSGRLAPEKRMDVALEALALLHKDMPEISLIATGHGAAEEGLKTLAQKLGIASSVQFPGFVSIETLVEYYKAADVFVMLSTAETQSLVLMQAYAAGVPAVVARAGALPEYTPLGCGFLTEVGNAKEVAKKLKQLLTNPELRKTMGTSARAYVERFSPAAVAQEWKEIYAKSLSR
jgi:glycosyltransferase involved in cell wall biosynthesis